MPNRYIEKSGPDPERLLEEIFPVVRTEMGNIGTLICAEGSFPEAARALALNEAEIIYRAAYFEPRVGNAICLRYRIEPMPYLRIAV